MELKKELQKAFANINLMYIKSTNFHYNVEGANFLSVHKMFEKHYELFIEWTDIVGELLKKEKWEVRPSMTYYKEHGSISDAKDEVSVVDCVTSQLESFKQIKKDFVILGSNEESITIADAFTTILHEIDKSIWFMSAILSKAKSCNCECKK